jgi:DHA2 family multidrug resistance protein
MDPIPREEMGNATSLFNLMRNVGGSMGIACASTYLYRRQQFHTFLLGAHVSAYSPATQNFRSGMESTMMAHGSSAPRAASQSLATLWGMVQQQASMLSFVDTFVALALVFLLVLPLLFVLKRPRQRGAAVIAH